MASLFWVGGTGTYDGVTNHFATTSGGVASVAAPTSSDTVTFDTLSNATAYTVTISAILTCSDLTFGNPLSGVITVAGTGAITVAGNFTWATGMTRTFSGVTTFTATSGTKTITSNGISFSGTIIFNGSGGTFQLVDNLLFKGVTFTLTAGTFDATTNSRTVTLDFSGSTGNSITGAFTFYNLSLIPATPSTSILLNLSANIVITNLFTINNGATVTNRCLILSSVIGTPRTITSASNSFNNVDFKDITAAGAASWNLAAITGLSGDCGGNTGITFTTPVDQHWQNASSANWSTLASWTSRVPLPQDNVFMDKAFGTSQTVTADMPRLGANIDWTGATFTTNLTWAISTGITFFGSLTLISGLTTSGSQVITLGARSNINIDTKAVSMVALQMNVSTVGATVTLTSNLTITGALILTSGTFNAATFNVTILNYSFSSASLAKTLMLGSGNWTLTGTGTVWTDTGVTTYVAGNSTIKITDTSNTAITFSGAGKTYNNIWFARGASTASNTIAGSNTFNDFKDDGSVAHSLLTTAGTTQHFTTFTVSGTAGNLITLNSTTTATYALVKDGGGTISSDYLNIQHSVATPSTTWYAGANSTDNQAVATAGSGWIFTAPPAGNTGNMFLVM